MVEDPAIMKFMAWLPSPTYEFAWLTDWFGIFIKELKGNIIKEEDKNKA